MKSGQLSLVALTNTSNEAVSFRKRIRNSPNRHHNIRWARSSARKSTLDFCGGGGCHQAIAVAHFDRRRFTGLLQVSAVHSEGRATGLWSTTGPHRVNSYIARCRFTRNEYPYFIHVILDLHQTAIWRLCNAQTLFPNESQRRIGLGNNALPIRTQNDSPHSRSVLGVN